MWVQRLYKIWIYEYISYKQDVGVAKILTPISDLVSWNFRSFWMPWVLSYPVTHVPPSHGTPPGSQTGLLKSNSFNSCAVATVSSERPKKPSWLVSSCWNLKELANMPSYTCWNIFKIWRGSFWKVNHQSKKQTVPPMISRTMLQRNVGPKQRRVRFLYKLLSVSTQPWLREQGYAF